MSTPSPADSALVQRIAALSEARRALLVRHIESLRRAAGSPAALAAGASEGLLAQVVARAGHAPTPEALREHLAARLPAHMLPRRVVLVGGLPRTAAGKLDRDALLVPRAETADDDSAHAATAPGSEAEQILARLWMEVLGVSEVGVDEDFFELGGDSLLSIRILSRANQEGLRICPDAFFANPTVAGQARAATQNGGAEAERGPVSGALPLTPIQHWFFDRIPTQPHHWNQCFVFELRKPLGLSTLERAVQALLHHHDALRMQFDISAMTANIALPDAHLPVSRIDLRECADTDIAHRIDATASRLNASLDLAHAPLLRVVLFQTRAGVADRLLLLAHHLLVDGLSWRILLEDLDRACSNDEGGEPIRLPARTTSCKRWSESLTTHAQDQRLRAELEYWRDVCAQPATLPLDFESGENRVCTARNHRLSFDADTSAALLRELPGVYRVGVDRLLLTALAVSLCRWRGTGPLRLDVEGHGREGPSADVDVSRTVGWFTSVFPLCLDIRSVDDPLAALAEVKTQAAAIPGGGLGFGLLRELCEDAQVRAALHGPPSQLLFNYLGQVGQLGRVAGRLRLERDTCGTPRAPQGLRAYLLEINAFVDDAVLRLDWSYSSAFHRDSTVAALAADFERVLVDLLERARGGETVNARPEDFPLAGLDQGELDNLADLLGEIDAGESPEQQP